MKSKGILWAARTSQDLTGTVGVIVESREGLWGLRGISADRSMSDGSTPEFAKNTHWLYTVAAWRICTRHAGDSREGYRGHASGG